MDRIALLAGAAAISLVGAADAAPLSTNLTLTGFVNNPATYGLAELQALPATTETASPDSFTGTPIWTLLTSSSASGGIKTVLGPSVKNETLRDYVLATGTDGYTVVYSVGELDPNFGGNPPPGQNLVAYQVNGGSLGANGFARTVVPGDVKRGRYVSNLTTMQVVQEHSLKTGTGGGVSSQLALSGAVAHPGTFALADLIAFDPTPTTETATFLAGGTPTTHTYTGVSLWDFLNAAGLVNDPSIKNDILRKYVVVTGSDGYQVVLSLGEIDPDFGDPALTDLIAYSEDGTGSLDGDGFARLVVPGDVRGGRYVSNITSIEVFEATVPEPAALALMLAGLAALTFCRKWTGALA